MQSNLWIRRAGGALVPALLLLAAGAVAKEPVSGLAAQPKAGAQHRHPTDVPKPPGAEPTHGAIVSEVVPLGDHWLGIECYPVPPALRVQLNLPERQGLVVENVMPDSPAAKAGVKPFDILMKVGDKPLKGPGELIQAVNVSKDKEMVVELLRGAKTVKIKVKPAPRPQGDAEAAPGAGSGDADWDTLRKWVEQARRRLERQVGPEGEMPLRFRFFHPGAILPPGASLLPALPADTTVSFSKQGNEPAKITVTRGKDKWEGTEKELDKVPADLRPFVEQVLGRNLFGRGGAIGIRVAPAPGEEAKPEPSKGPRAAAPTEQPGSNLERRLEQRLERHMDLMNRRFEQLQKSINELRERQPGRASPKPREEKRGEGI